MFGRFGVFLITCMAFSWFYSTFFLHACFAIVPDEWLRFRVELWVARLVGWGGKKQVVSGGGESGMKMVRVKTVRGPSTEMTRLRLGSQGSVGSGEGLSSPREHTSLALGNQGSIVGSSEVDVSIMDNDDDLIR